MIVGAMNHPQRDAVDEINELAGLGLEFIDLTLEPPAAASWKVSPDRIRRALDKHHLQVVGHTAFYLPMASPFEELRKASVAEFRRCLEIFAAVGAKWMNIHPDRRIPMHDRSFWVERNIVSLRELEPDAQRLGVGLMIENLPEAYNDVPTLQPFFHALPDLGLHLDVGHANLMVEKNTTPALMQAFGNRLRHVHLHDNKGGTADLHLPLGAGTLDVTRCLKAVKHTGYDGPITLEVFSHDRHYLQYSAQVLRDTWKAL